MCSMSIESVSTSMYAPIHPPLNQADGSLLAAAPVGGLMYLSEDYGVTWYSRSPAGGTNTRNWFSLAMRCVFGPG